MQRRLEQEVYIKLNVYVVLLLYAQNIATKYSNSVNSFNQIILCGLLFS